MTYRHSTPKPDVYQRVTDAIVTAIERGAGTWQFPWNGRQAMPVNAASGHKYRGVNVVSLWAVSSERAWPHQWASYRQWQQAGAQVRRGERGSIVVFYKTLKKEKRGDDGNVVTDDDGEPKVDSIYLARASVVFNAAQVDGFQPEPEPERPLFERIERAETFVGNTGAIVRHGGDRAFYRPSADQIQLPEREAFKGTETSTPAEGYYGTLLHELTHWSGHEARCNRDLRNRFGSEAYAAEELVAELGAAFLCADLGITQQPRLDHAQYIQSWLRVLRNDKRAIFTASSKAAQAADYLGSLQTETARPHDVAGRSAR